MNENTRYARRYHWLSDEIDNFIEEPHSAICCDKLEDNCLDMTAKESRTAREVSLDLVNAGVNHLRKYLDKQKTLINFTMPEHHPVLKTDLTERDMKILRNAYEIQPKNYEELISISGVGAKKIRALALISDLVYGAKSSWKDPVKYSYTHGGKDGFPYPVNREVYDSSILTLKEALDNSKIGNNEKKEAIKRLNKFIS